MAEVFVDVISGVTPNDTSTAAYGRSLIHHVDIDLSVVSIIFAASLPVKAVMVILLLCSLISWWIIFRKHLAFARALRDTDRFERQFWSGQELNTLHADITKKGNTLEGMERVFAAGYGEFAKHSQYQAKLKAHVDSILSGIQRAMRVASNRECELLEQNLAILATIGSTSPYIGLFGTVWGIMSSFHALGNVEQVSLAMVAPGISEALIATAMGLFAAIPAVIAYNRFSLHTERLYSRYELFVEEFAIFLYHRIQAIP